MPVVKLEPERIRERINSILPDAMDKTEIDSWLILTREISTDPIAGDVGGDLISATGALFFYRDSQKLHRHAIVVGFNVDSLKEIGIYDNIVTYRGEELWQKLNNLLAQFNPKKIAINYSESSPACDGLSAGLYKALQTRLDPIWKDKLVQAEDLVTAFRSKRLPNEVELLRNAAVITEKILRKVLSRECITPGKTTEIKLARQVHEEMALHGVGHAWDMRENPIINTGLLRGHSRHSSRVIEPGHVVKLDFGVTYQGLCSDMQRSAYVLKPGETKPPAQIERLFNVTRRAIDLAVAAMKPGVRGCDIDKIARDAVMNEGFPSYRHATGHPIGYDVHELGPYLAQDIPSRYGNKIYLPLEVGQVFCVEPAAPFFWPELGGDIEVGLEDEVVITPSGAKNLCPPQESLWTI